MKNVLRKYIFYFGKFCCVFLVILVLNYFVTWYFTYKEITSNEKEISRYHHILIPGAGNSPLGEWQNPTFSKRLNACVKLFAQNKITRIVCSGKLKRPYYNEAADMKEFLLKKHIPGSVTVLDNASHTTRQTVFNYALKYPQDSVIIISQEIHLTRALFAAKVYGLKAKGFSAGKYDRGENQLLLYEALARMKLSLGLLFL